MRRSHLADTNSSHRPFESVSTGQLKLDGVQAVVGTLAPKWSVAVLAQLAGGTARFSELTREIGVSRRMLSATLRALEREGIVERRVYADVPVRVEYDLSPAGEELCAALEPLSAWSRRDQPAPPAL
jgi:DNA-binding HxlR family transcriptional regulator